MPSSPIIDKTLAVATCGFAASVATWAAGYVTHLPGLGLAPSAIGGVLIAVQVMCALLGGRALARSGVGAPWALGLLAGLTTGLINLLVLGALLAQEQPGEGMKTGWMLKAAGYVGASGVLGLIGGLLGGSRRAAPIGDAPAVSVSRLWLSRFAKVAALSVLPVLLSGGLVTSAEAGLAVRDWPTSFTANMFLFPLSKMTGGIYYEHAHRLFGSLAGLTVLTLMVLALLTETRPSVKLFAVLAFSAVLSQGILGGVRVALAPEKGDAPTDASVITAAPVTADTAQTKLLAMAHGVSGQLVFGLLCALAAVMSARWVAARGPNDPAPPRDGALRVLSAGLLLMLTIQLTLGAGLRHFEHVGFMHSHITGAVLTLIIAALVGFRLSAHHRDSPTLRRVGKSLFHTLGLQVALGIAALLTLMPYYNTDKVEPVHTLWLATAHQAVGALLLGIAAAAAAWTRRLA